MKWVKGEMGKCRSGGTLLQLLLFFSLFPFYLLPVSPLLAAGQTGEADLLVKKIEARYGRMRGLAAEFEQTYSAQGSRVRRESGRLFLARPRKMRWEYTGKLFIVNGRDVWFYVMADREATHADISSIADERFPFLFLLGQTNLRRAFSSISIVENSDVAEAGARTLRLVPRRSAGGLREIFLDVATDGRILRVKLWETSGAVSEISLRNVQENVVAPPEAFEFRPPAGVTVRKQ